MRLGIVMTGTGACAAACVGALEALLLRSMDVHAVCGMGDGAWCAAQYLCEKETAQMKPALSLLARAENRGMRAKYPAKMLFSGKKAWLSEGECLGRLINAQTGERLLALCRRRGIIPMRIACSGRRLVFSTCAYDPGSEASLCRQATVGFAARAAMAHPPMLSPLMWGGSYLLAEEDRRWAANQLLCMGADRVIVIDPRLSSSRTMNALELAAVSGVWTAEEARSPLVGLMTIRMPPHIGALDFMKMDEIVRIGYEAAQSQLDALLEGLGMAQCRILPFKARVSRLVNLS